MTVSVTDKPISVAPEWGPQRAMWTAWPANVVQWNANLAAPRRDVAAMVRALAGTNRVRLLVNGVEAETSARAALGEEAEIVRARYGDIWLRDTGPIFARAPDGAVALRFKTNSWGGKYDLPDDATVGDRHRGARGLAHLEIRLRARGRRRRPRRRGHDPDHAPVAAQSQPQRLDPEQRPRRRCAEALRRQKDRLARRRPRERPHRRPRRQPGPLRRAGAASPASRLRRRRPERRDLERRSPERLEQATDAAGRKLEVDAHPWRLALTATPTARISPASHMNFLIANGAVIVPIYGTPTQPAALEALQRPVPRPPR